MYYVGRVYWMLLLHLVDAPTQADDEFLSGGGFAVMPAGPERVHFQWRRQYSYMYTVKHKQTCQFIFVLQLWLLLSDRCAFRIPMETGVNTLLYVLDGYHNCVTLHVTKL